MNKRELINLLESLNVPDDREVCVQHFEYGQIPLEQVKVKPRWKDNPGEGSEVIELY